MDASEGPLTASLHRGRRPYGVTSDEAYISALEGELGAVIDWSCLDPEIAESEWWGLREWVEWLVQRYVLDFRVVPPCWYLHPGLVDVLSALRDHHRYSFDRLAQGTAAADWHLVFRILEARLREWASRTGCSRDAHRPDLAGEWPNDSARWREHVGRATG